MALKSLAAFIAVGSATPAAAQTVMDMFLEIPAPLLGVLENPDEPTEKTSDQKKKALSVTDLKNGYLATKSDVHIAKFNRRNGTPLLAVAGSSYADSGRGGQKLQFFAKNKSNAWEDLTAQIFPGIPDIVSDAIDAEKCRPKSRLSDSASGTYRYMLPRKGKSILAVTETDRQPTCNKTLFTLDWDGERLVMKINDK